jgi:hypothetical protein
MSPHPLSREKYPPRLTTKLPNGEGNVTAIIFLDEHPSLRYGFKPGGPSAVWTVDDESDETSLPVNGVSIEIPIYKRKLA